MIEAGRPITYGILKPGSGFPGGIPVVKVKDMRDGIIDQSDLLLTSPEIDAQYQRSKLRKGDLLISIRGSVGRMAEVPENLENANITQDTARLTIDAAYNKVYVRGVLESAPLQLEMERNIRGVAVKGINIGFLRELQIPVCARTVQDRLAALYEQSDKSKFTEHFKSQFIELFGDPIENPFGWITTGLTTLGNYKNGMNFGANEKGVDIRCVGVGDVKDLDKIENLNSLTLLSLNELPSKEYLLEDGDIVFVRSNGNKNLVGRCVSVYPGSNPITFSGFCIRFRKTSESILITYLLQLLKQQSVRAKLVGRGANIQNLNQKMLAALDIPLPPADLQKEYDAFIQQTDKSKYVAFQETNFIENLLKYTYNHYFRRKNYVH